MHMMQTASSLLYMYTWLHIQKPTSTQLNMLWWCSKQQWPLQSHWSRSQ